MPSLKLGRKKDHRDLLVRNLLSSLIVNERITTTVAKAKLVKPAAERVLNLAKKEDLSSKRKLAALLAGQKKAQDKASEYWGEKLRDRSSGQIKILKLGQRLSDGAEMAIVEIVGAEPIAVIKDAKRVKKEQQDGK